MKCTNPLQKYKYKKVSIYIFTAVTVLLLVAFLYLNYKTTQLNISAGTCKSEDVKNETLKNYNIFKTATEVDLIALSIFASSLISSLLIEKNNSNKIVEEVFVDDFLTSDKFTDKLEENVQKQIFTNISKNLKFDGCKEKGEMYSAVVQKINNPIFKHNLFFDKYYIHSTCEIHDDYIEKSFIRTVYMKSFEKSENIKNYPLLSISSTKMEKYDTSKIHKIKINDKEIDISKKIDINVSDTKTQLDKNRGYLEKIEYIYKETLDFSNKNPTKIEIEYVTRCPKNDNAYTCRLQYPCRYFDFNFNLKNNDYRLNTNAFGFIDDAKSSPNHSNDNQSVAIRIDNWMFPCDGVCIYLEKTVAK